MLIPLAVSRFISSRPSEALQAFWIAVARLTAIGAFPRFLPPESVVYLPMLLEPFNLLLIGSESHKPLVAVIQALMVAVGLIAAITAQGASPHNDGDGARNAHERNKTKASSTFTPSVHDEAIRRANDRALAALSPSPQATNYAASTPISNTSPTANGAVLGYLFFGFLVLGTFIIIAVVSKDSRLATTAPPPVPPLSEEVLQFQIATLNDLRNGIIPRHYHLRDFLPQKGESVLWAFHGVKHYYQTTQSVWVGRSAGLNVRVAKGVWLHSGSSYGHRVPRVSTHTEIGTLVFTSKALCFIGTNSARIPFTHVLAFDTYKDGFGFVTDLARKGKYIFGDMHPQNVAFLRTALGLLHSTAL